LASAGQRETRRDGKIPSGKAPQIGIGGGKVKRPLEVCIIIPSLLMLDKWVFVSSPRSLGLSRSWMVSRGAWVCLLACICENGSDCFWVCRSCSGTGFGKLGGMVAVCCEVHTLRFYIWVLETLGSGHWLDWWDGFGLVRLG